MTDTPKYMYERQLAIFEAMSPGKRIEVCLEMIDDGRELVLDQLRRKHPEWTNMSHPEFCVMAKATINALAMANRSL